MGKPVITGSSDPAFRGDAARYNPEELLLMSLSSCHMLWFLHLCTVAGIVVTAYTDHAAGTMEENSDGSGRFVEVILKPVVTISTAVDEVIVSKIQHRANQQCFIANSVNFPVRHQPVYYFK